MAHTEQHGVAHETSDAHVGGVVRLLVITIGFLVVSFGLMAWMFSSFKASQEAADVKPAPVAQRQADRLPPLPRLQTTPYPDLKAFQASERQVLDSYAWVDQANGVVRMPIANAIAHVAAHGLPAFAPASAPVAPGGAAAGGPSGPVAPGGAAAGGPSAPVAPGGAAAGGPSAPVAPGGAAAGGPSAPVAPGGAAAGGPSAPVAPGGAAAGGPSAAGAAAPSAAAPVH